jgi:hypothetical protein
MIRANAEEALAAGSATVRGEKKQTLQTEKNAIFDAIA